MKMLPKEIRDETREIERLRHLNGAKECVRSRSRTPPSGEYISYFQDKTREKERLKRSNGGQYCVRPRSRSPPSGKYISYYRDEERIRLKHLNGAKHCGSSRSRSSYRASRRDYRRPKSYSRPRSRLCQSRERSSIGECDKEIESQFIRIPVAVPTGYAYSFTCWPTVQSSFWSSQHCPTPAVHYDPYHMLPMMPLSHHSNTDETYKYNSYQDTANEKEFETFVEQNRYRTRSCTPPSGRHSPLYRASRRDYRKRKSYLRSYNS